MKQNKKSTKSRGKSKAKARVKQEEMADEEIIPHGNDILMGRGGKNNQHVGNEQLRNICRGQRESYRLSSKKGKSHISREIVAYVRSMSPPGRFLKKDAVTGDWEDVGDDTAREKVSQVLRDAVSAIHSSPSSSPSPSSATARRASSNDATSSSTVARSGRSESAPTIVISTPPASAPPATSRYGRRYTASSRRASASDDARLHMKRSGNGRSYSPSQVTSLESSYHPSPDRQLHRSSADHHHHQQPYPQEPHRQQHHRNSHHGSYQYQQSAYHDQRYHPYSRPNHQQGHYPHHGYHQDRRYQHQYQQYSAYNSSNEFEYPRQRHHSAPSAVGDASTSVTNSNGDVPHSPIYAATAKGQRQEQYRTQEYAFSRSAHMYQHSAPHAVSRHGASSDWSSAAAAAVTSGPSHEEDFDLFNGSLLNDFDRPVKTDRSVPAPATSAAAVPAPAPAAESAPAAPATTSDAGPTRTPPPIKKEAPDDNAEESYGGLSSSTF